MGAGPDRDASAGARAGGGLRGAAAHDLQAPGAAALEELVRVDLVPPAEEMGFGIIVRRAENREALLGFIGGRTALQLLQPALGLFGGRPSMYPRGMRQRYTVSICAPKACRHRSDSDHSPENLGG